MIRCEDNSIYTGITSDIKKRMIEHFEKQKNCAKYTRVHSANKIEAIWETLDRKLAAKLEYHIKKLNKIDKEELIINNDFWRLEHKLEPENYKRCEIDV